MNDSIVLLGQVINKVAYERRLAVLGALHDVKHAKKQLKENQEEFRKEDKFLFGKEFQSQLKTLKKAQESAEKLLTKSSSTSKNTGEDGGRKRKYPFGDRPFSPSSSSYHGYSRPSGGATNMAARNRGGGSF